MKLYNTVIVYDVYIMAETQEAAEETIRRAIRTPDDAGNFESPSEQASIECREERHVRKVWQDKKPFVADDISDADFERVRGKTTLETLNMLHKKVEPKK